MPQYYNPGLFPVNYAQPTYMVQPSSYSASPPSYMISVDGEQAARAWQMPNGVAPGTVIPLFDVDGTHVYFKSVNAYGQLNPLRKGRVVMEEEQPVLPAGQSGAQTPVATDYVTRDDLSSMEKRITESLAQMIQNGGRRMTLQNNNPGQNPGKGGENR